VPPASDGAGGPPVGMLVGIPLVVALAAAGTLIARRRRHA
jgi:hypothetical protein